MFSKFFKHTPTEQEQQFIEIVEGLLANSNTTIKMTPLTDKYFLSNEKNHYYAVIKENGIQVTNTKFSFAKSLHPKTYNMIIDKIHSVMEIERQKFEDQIFKNETEMLNNVLSNLK